MWRRAILLWAGVCLCPGASAADSAAVADETIWFQSGSALLGPVAVALIERLAAQTRVDASAWVVLESCTSDFRGREMNLALGTRRIDAIRQAMTDRGIPLHRVRGITTNAICADGGNLPGRRVVVRIERPAP